MKAWVTDVLQSLDQSMGPIKLETNDLDWKMDLSPDRKRLAEHISAFANQNSGGVLAFGISHLGQRVGVEPETAKTILTSISNIARDGLEPACRIDHHIHMPPHAEEGTFPLLLVKIEESPEKPVHLRGKPLDHSFIRSGGQTRRMDIAEIRRALLSSRTQRFEELEVPFNEPQRFLDQLDLKPICERLHKPFPESPDRRNDVLVDLKFASKTAAGLRPTYLAVLIGAREFSQLPGCERFGIKLTQYGGTSKLTARRETVYSRGFALFFDEIITEILRLLPQNEIIDRATRRMVPLYPDVALRELLANAVIHRDYSRTDSFVNVDLFDDRVEITNPGSLLPDMAVDRLIDQQPRARNEVLASFMRELGFCEERGSGIDRAAFALELQHLPAIEFINRPDSFRTVLYAPKPYESMGWEERLRTVYQQVCLHFVMRKPVTNATLRERFDLDIRRSQLVSLLIRRAIQSKLIKPANPGTSPRYIHYVPYWA